MSTPVKDFMIPPLTGLTDFLLAFSDVAFMFLRYYVPFVRT